MSNTSAWTKRISNYRYSQDERALSWKFKNEINSRVEAFLDDQSAKELIIGTYDIGKEPWRLLAIADYRKYNVKIGTRPVSTQSTEPEQKQDNPLIKKSNIVEVILVKQKLSKQFLH
jgi:hypothetical protein